MPSVMHTISFTPASAAARIASAAPGAGTKITLTSAPVALTASGMVLKTGTPRCSVPPRPGRAARHDLRAVLDALLGVERTLLAGQALADDLGMSC